METTILNEDILIHCVTASSFPEGVQKAHETLHTLFKYHEHRNYFGISWPAKDGTLIYKAAAQELHEGELEQFDLETKTIKKGSYLYIDVPDFMKNIPAIGISFQQLIHDERIAPDGFCIEWYLNQNLCRCMVKMK